MGMMYIRGCLSSSKRPIRGTIRAVSLPSRGGGNNFDAITPSIKIEDNVLKNIIRLYYPDSPYVFSEIPADILGHVYEQFLGKVIQLDESHKVERGGEA